MNSSIVFKNVTGTASYNITVLHFKYLLLSEFLVQRDHISLSVLHVYHDTELANIESECKKFLTEVSPKNLDILKKNEG